MKRRFSKSQKTLLYIFSEGYCANCGAPLQSGWHADHVTAWSKGGETEMRNGQALCPKCNLSKGNRGMLQDWTKPLRIWQQEALDRYLQHTEKDFLLEATPGAGKTTFTLRVLHSLLQSQRIDTIVVVCPTDHLKRQWAREAHLVGIELDPEHDMTTVNVKSGYQGITTTYQQVAGEVAQAVFGFMMRKRRACVVFDEIHHAAESRSWGDALKRAFEDAHFRLGLSGTPFRGDNNRIPFVHYSENGTSIPDYSYTYSDSLRDEVCRYVFFPKYEGRMEWVSGIDGEMREASFADELSEREASERLNTAISLSGEWINQVLDDANNRLRDLRLNGHTNAGGLVIAKDKRHAQGIADLLRKVTGVSPVVATSDVADASSKIEAFRNGSDPWIVAVKMVSEGVDIPRLRVLVYATNVATELFFRQAVGRVIRTIPGLEEQNAFFFIPNDPTLVTFAHAIQEQREHQLRDEAVVDAEFPDEYEYKGDRIPIPSSFTPINSEAEADGAIFSASDYSQEELDDAQRIVKEVGQLYMAPEVAASIIRKARETQTPSSISSTQTSIPVDQVPLYQKEKKLRKEIQYLVSKYAAMTGKEYKDVYTEWLRNGGTRQGKASLPELERKRDWLKERIADLA